MTARARTAAEMARLAIVERNAEESGEKADGAVDDVRRMAERVRKIEATVNHPEHGNAAIAEKLGKLDTKLDEVLEARKLSGAHRIETDARISSLTDAQRELAAKLAVAREDYARELKASAEPLDAAEARQLRAEMYRTVRGHVPTIVRVAVLVFVAACIAAAAAFRSCSPGGF